jgi:hypothetical protein
LHIRLRLIFLIFPMWIYEIFHICFDQDPDLTQRPNNFDTDSHQYFDNKTIRPSVLSMRFINTTSFKFHEVSDLEVQRLKNGYSILSHRWTWGDEEIMYVDILSMGSAVKAKAGYTKFTGACALAKKLGYDLIWIDTCCINKTDSVELGEAINSMYRWYALAKICIAYLQDVNSPIQFSSSDWFNRGWTLQELIAPKTVRFYDCSWKNLGDKASLSNILVKKTGIPADVLKNTKPVQAYSIAQRMSWAANRTTKRLEDRAYSLMGLFGVNMPMIYGEREGAFMRLQEQIISKSADESIFVWDLDLLESSTRDAKNVLYGLLATSPACFARCGDVVSRGNSQGFHINQFGLSISLPATLFALGTYQASFNVTKAKGTGQCTILLVQLRGGKSFARISSSLGESVLMTKTPAVKSMRFNISLQPAGTPLSLYPGFWLRKLGFYDSHISTYKVLRRRYVAEGDRLVLPEGKVDTAGIIMLSLRNGTQPAGFGWIKLGFDSASRPICFVTFPDKEDNDPNTKLTPTEAEKLLAMDFGTPARLYHPLFNDEWVNALNRTMSPLPPHSYDSRSGTTEFDNGFDFTFKAPLFDISISAKRIPDTRPTTSKTNDVWAIEIVAGTAPQPTYHGSSGCC